jgi:hypothetical protein
LKDGGGTRGGVRGGTPPLISWPVFKGWRRHERWHMKWNLREEREAACGVKCCLSSFGQCSRDDGGMRALREAACEVKHHLLSFGHISMRPRKSKEQEAACGVKHRLLSFGQCSRDERHSMWGETPPLMDFGSVQGIEEEIYHISVVVVICALLLINLLHLTSVCICPFSVRCDLMIWQEKQMPT